MEIDIRLSSDPKDIWVTFVRKEGYWEDDDGERPNKDIEFALENLSQFIENESYYQQAHPK